MKSDHGKIATLIGDIIKDIDVTKEDFLFFLLKNGTNKFTSEEELVDVRKELQYYKEELTQSQRENQQLKQQIYNLQHPQQSWDEPER